MSRNDASSADGALRFAENSPEFTQAAHPSAMTSVANPTRPAASSHQSADPEEDQGTRAAFRTPSTLPLEPGDYPTWAMQMQALLEYAGLWPLVDPGPKTPSESASEFEAPASGAASVGGASAATSSTVTNPRSKRATEAHLMLSLALRDSETRRVLIGLPPGDPRALWVALQRRFTFIPKAATAALYSQFFSLRQKGGESVREFADRLILHRHQLASNGRNVSDDDAITVFVNGVAGNFSHSVTSYYNLASNPSLDAVVQVARGEEARLLLQPGQKAPSTSSALGVSQHQGQLVCHGCGSPGHFIAQCPQRSQQQHADRRREGRTATQQEVSAGACPKPGHRSHKASECRQGRPPAGSPTSGGSSSQASLVASNGGGGDRPRSIVSVGIARVSTGESKPAAAVSVMHTLPAADQSFHASASHTQVVLDSGAGRTVIPTTGRLLDGQCASDVQITVANGQTLLSPTEGTAVIDAAGDMTLHVHNSLQHPEIDRTLLSVSSLLANQAAVKTVVFEREGAVAFTPAGGILLTATQRDGIYLLDTDVEARENTIKKVLVAAARQSLQLTPTAAVGEISSALAESVAGSNTGVQLWHNRLCHRSLGGITELVSSNAVAGMDVQRTLRPEDLCRCDGCAKAKAKRSPFSDHMHPSLAAKHLLARIHADLAGPISPVTLGGASYFLVLLDEWSGFSVVVLLKAKSEAAAAIADFIRRAHTRHGRYPTEFHSDGGGEFINAKLQKFFRRTGTWSTQTEVNTPQHNAKAERLIRTEAEWTNAILIHAGAPRCFWGHAIDTVNYVRNLTQLGKNVDVASPTTAHARWFALDGPVSLTHLRVWGCDADVKISVGPGAKLPKLTPKSRLCMFVGYDADRNYAWLFWDPTTLVVLASRDAVFHEQQFTVAHAAMASERESAESTGEEETDQDWLTRTTWDAETRLVQMISKEMHDAANAPQADDAAAGAAAGQGALDSEDDDSESESESGSSDGDSAASSLESDDAPLPAAQAPPPAAVSVRRSTRERVQTHFYGKVNGNLAQGRAVYVQLALYSVETPLRLTLEKQAPLGGGAVPRTYAEAIQSPEWKAAVDRELEAHRLNGTWRVVPLPAGAKAIGFKYVFRIKLKPDGTIERYKCRLTAQGFSQREGIDYNETYAPVLHLTTLRALLAFVAAEDYELHQLDVETAFLNAYVEEDIYLRVPDGVDAPPGSVLKLVKALYGIKQAPRAWYEDICHTLVSVMGYHASSLDACLFLKRSRTGRWILFPLFVDDGFPCCHRDDLDEMVADKAALMAVYKIKDGGEATLVLGMRVTRDRQQRTLKIDQQVYVEKLLEDYGATTAKWADSPEAGEVADQTTGQPVRDADSAPAASESDAAELKTFYRALVGSLQYPALCTRPDLTHAVHTLACGVAAPTALHRACAWRVLRYLAGTKELGITFGGRLDGRPMVAYSDANWAGRAGENEGKSTSGWLVKIGSGPVSWSSKKQSMVALSSTESEYVAAALATQEIMWLRGLLADFGVGGIERPTVLRCDNTAAIALAQSDSTSQRSKHINVRFHFIRQAVRDGTIQLDWVSTHQQPADVFTKPLGPQSFLRIRPCILGDVERL